MVTSNKCFAEQIKSGKAENVVMDGSEVGEFGKSITKGLARRNLEKHAILAEVGEKDQRVLCIDGCKLQHWERLSQKELCRC